MAKELKDCMTSELLFQAGICTNEAEKATYLSEYERRLKFMGLTDEVIQKFREADQAASTMAAISKLTSFFLQNHSSNHLWISIPSKWKTAHFLN